MPRTETYLVACVLLEVRYEDSAIVSRKRIRKAWLAAHPEDDRPRSGNRREKGVGPGCKATDRIRIGLVELEQSDALIRRQDTIRVTNWPLIRKLANSTRRWDDDRGQSQTGQRKEVSPIE